MINLNLLPQKQKEIITFEKARRHLLTLGGTIFFALIIFTILLLSAYLYLAINLEAQNRLIKVTQETPESQKLEKIEGDIEKINSEIDKIYNIQKNFVLWSEIIEDLINSIPSGIYLKNFSGNNSQIVIYGFAPTREHLLDFERALRDNKRFFDVYSPPSNLLKKTDIDFHIAFKFKNLP